MWKLLAGFALFAGLAVFMLMKSGGNVDLGGEKHEVVTATEPGPAAASASAASQ